MNQDPLDALRAEILAGEDDLPLSDEAVTRELRSMGRILDPVSENQKKQLDMIAGMKAAKKKKRRRK